MVKLAITMLMAFLVCQGFSSPLIQDGDIGMAASKGDWGEVQRILKQFVDSRLATPPAQLAQGSGLSYGSLQQQASGATNGGASPGGRYYTQNEYSYQRASNNNGVVSEDKGGLGMIDDNGSISYYKPNPDSYAQVQRPSSGNTGASAASPNGQGRR